MADGEDDWVRLYDYGIARLPSGAIAPAQARSWREGFRWPLLLSGLLWMVLLSPPVRGWRGASAAVLVTAAVGAGTLLPGSAQAQERGTCLQ